LWGECFATMFTMPPCPLLLNEASKDPLAIT
jgi:hypothetical protein